MNRHAGRGNLARRLTLLSASVTLAYLVNAALFALLYTNQWKRDTLSFAAAAESDSQQELRRLTSDIELSGQPAGPLQERRDELVEALRSAAGYEDFFYFSVVTMTTLGYGDIVPNSREARRLVYLQVLLAVVFAAVAIPFFFAAAARRPDAGNGN